VESRKSEAPTLDLSPTHTGWLERLFKLRLHGTTVKTELIAGLTTFITMAYIIFVNPNIMADAGIDHGAAFVATCCRPGLPADGPVRQLAGGPGAGHGPERFFTYTVVGTMGYHWETALGAVFISGVLFMGLTLSRVREWLLNSIPVSLRHAMGAGVGLFLGVIGLKTAGIIVDSPATLIKLGSLHEPAPLLAAVCFLMIAILSYHRVFGAILISIIAVTLAGWGLGLVHYNGILSTPPSLAPTWMAMDVKGVFNVSMISVVFAFLFVHMFDTAGTLMGVAQRAGLVNADGRSTTCPAP
jgi:AGZA family xanthine/uracil permease-like MFS transporter